MKLKKEIYDVIFYYPQHFNRGDNNSNPYFEPLINSCKKYNVSYLLLEEPSFSSISNSSKNLHQKYFYWLYFILVFRKLIPLFLFSNFEARERFLGKLINLLTFGCYRAKNYITLSNSLGGVLRGISPESKIFDYQHGIITSTQPGFFTVEKNVPDWIKSNEKEVLVYGKGFESIMKKTNPEYYSNKVFAIGQANKKMEKYTIGKNILVSLQILEEENVSVEWLQTQVDLLNQLFYSYNKANHIQDGSVIYLRHHPRSTKTFNLEQLYAYDFVKEFDESKESYEVGLHITFFSTSAFEFASLGIPTLFLYNDIIPQGKDLFFEEFNYPFPKIETIEDWQEKLLLDKDNEVAETIKNWYQLFYQPYDENKFVNLLEK